MEGKVIVKLELTHLYILCHLDHTNTLRSLKRMISHGVLKIKAQFCMLFCPSGCAKTEFCATCKCQYLHFNLNFFVFPLLAQCLYF